MKRFIYTIGLILLLPSYIIAGPVPDTGQTTSYTDTFGEDSDYTRIPPSYTKLDSAGGELADGATSWAMVRDNVTGLIWEAKGAGDSTPNYSDPNDPDNTYTWYDSTLATFPGTLGDNNTEDFITDLNAANYGGQSDWRLPTARELKSIVNYNENGPSVNQTYFSNTEPWDYWSSTPNADTSGLNTELTDRGAWRVSLNRGHVRISPSGTLLYARAVRGTQNDANDFADNGDGTVTDFSTGLMWMQDHAVTPMNWEAAIVDCEGLDFAGYDDWWLPNTNELQSIVDFGSYDPVAIDTTFFPGTEPFQYWSSTTYTVNSNAAWFVNFDDGIMQSLSSTTNKSGDTYYVRAVRGANVEFIDVGGGERITLESEPGTVLSNIQTVAPTAPLPDDTTFPYGLIGFQIDGVPSGSITLGSTTLTMTLPAGAAPTTYYKYGPTEGEPTDHWYEFLYDEATATGAVIEGNVITLHLGDGDRGDSDLTDDDTIIDPGGPVVEPNVQLVQVGTNTTIKLKSESGTTLSSESVSTPSDPPADTSFPYELLGYQISGVPSGSMTLGSTTLEITLPPGAYPTSYYQYGPTSGDATNHWYEDTSAEIEGRVITLNLVNGGWGDCDLNADTDVILVDSPRGSGPAFDINAVVIESVYSDDTILLETPVGTALSNVQAIDNPSPSDTPADAEFPYGVFTFEISGTPSGSMILDSTTLDITLPTGANPTSYYKYGPEKDVDETDHWYEFMYDDVTGTGAVINGNLITLYFGDGARGDSDLLDNDIIVDPGAPVFRTSSSNTPGNSGDDDDDDAIPYASSGGGGGGGCFIDSLIE